MIQREKLSLSVSSGAASTNTKDLRGMCGLIVVVPTTATTEYDLTLTDELSVVVYSRTGIVGTLRDSTLFPLRGIHTVALANVTVDETVIFALYAKESP